MCSNHTVAAIDDSVNATMNIFTTTTGLTPKFKVRTKHITFSIYLFSSIVFECVVTPAWQIIHIGIKVILNGCIQVILNGCYIRRVVWLHCASKMWFEDILNLYVNREVC